MVPVLSRGWSEQAIFRFEKRIDRMLKGHNVVVPAAGSMPCGLGRRKKREGVL